MPLLSARERELVAIGAAVGSHCVPCIEYHIPEARKTGLTDAELREAVRVADRVRQVPAKHVLDAARALLDAAPPATAAASTDACGCLSTPTPAARAAD